MRLAFSKTLGIEQGRPNRCRLGITGVRHTGQECIPRGDVVACAGFYQLPGPLAIRGPGTPVQCVLR